MPGLEALRLASDRRDTLLLFPSFHEEFILMQAVPTDVEPVWRSVYLGQQGAVRRRVSQTALLHV